MTLIPPSEALARVLAAVTRATEAETVPLAHADARTLAADVRALRTQPPFRASAMDGYAVRADDTGHGQPLRLIGEAAAGRPFHGAVGGGEAVRIFTGAPVPDGADAVLIQEDARAGAGDVTPLIPVASGRHMRAAGIDFGAGDVLLRAGAVLHPRAIGLAASMGHAALPVRRRPRVAIISTGDELVRPGEPLGPAQIVSSNAVALSTLLARTGAEALDMGVVPDDPDLTRRAIEASAGCDLIVTCGGASVGAHDHVPAALTAAGYRIDVWKVALRPGKPFMMAASASGLAVGLPGNPVSSYVCALLFVAPLIRALLGQPDPGAHALEKAILGAPLPANDLREDYMRARLTIGADGRLVAWPLPVQDSSLQSVLAEADALLIRPAHAPAAMPGEICQVIRL